MANIYEYKITVTAKDIDNLNHVNNAVYVRWMDEVASSHWNDLTKNNDCSDLIWVVKKHEIDYKSEAFLGDTLIAKTWVGETKGVTSERHIEFYKSNKLLVSSKTLWVLLNATSFKPMRISEKVLNTLLPDK